MEESTALVKGPTLSPILTMEDKLALCWAQVHASLLALQGVNCQLTATVATHLEWNNDQSWGGDSVALVGEVASQAIDLLRLFSVALMDNLPIPSL